MRGGSSRKYNNDSVEHYSRTISPQDWEKVLLLMLTVCFDTARTKISEGLVLVAGFGGFADVWTQFDSAWEERLRRDGLAHFHAGDLAHFRGQFETGWRDDEGRRRRLQQDLMDIIHAHGLRRFGCCVPVSVHNRIDAKITRFDAYVHAALASVDEFNEYARSIRVDRNVRYVFEKGEREDDLRSRFRDEGYTEPLFTWKTKHTDRKGFTHDGFLGLQSAGWLAYEYYLDAKRVAAIDTPLTSSIEEGRWAFQNFEKLAGRIQFLANPRISEQAMRVRDATKHLKEIRRRPGK